MTARQFRTRPVPIRGEPAPDRTLGRVPRRHRADEITRLHEEHGLAFPEIADRLLLAVSTVRRYYRDPDGETERRLRERYRGRCADCRRKTSGSAGPGRAPRYCRDCEPKHRRVWTKERVVDAIRAWATLTGSPPTAADWSPAQAPPNHPGTARYRKERRRWPSEHVVRKRFGSFRRGLEAAGFKAGIGGPKPRWSREEIVAAIRAHHESTGSPPRATDWARSGPDHPARSTVNRVVGSWTRALALAGVVDQQKGTTVGVSAGRVPRSRS